MNNESLVLDLLEWIGAMPRMHADVMRAWRTSCPRLTIWEDALDAGYVTVRMGNVRTTAGGLEFLSARRGISANRDNAGVA
jgi:hypothetical protein